MSNVTNIFQKFIRGLATSYSFIFVILTLCFAVTNLTNTRLLDYFSPFFMGVVRSSQESTEILTNLKFSGLSKLVLSPVKDTLFFFSLLALLAVNLGPVRDLIPELRTKARWLHILFGFLIASVFIFSVMPQSHGLVY